jgi:hypothetical protein
VPEVTLHAPFDELIQAKRIYLRASQPGAQQQKTLNITEGLACNNLTYLLTGTDDARGSSKHVMVEIQGLKPWTSALPGQRSNQLSYIPLFSKFWLLSFCYFSTLLRCYSQSFFRKAMYKNDAILIIMRLEAMSPDR